MNTAKKYSIEFGAATIEFKVQFRERKRLAIHVNPDKSVEVVAPEGKSIVDISNRIKKRASWILKQQDYFEQFHPLSTPRKYVSGETHMYLGRQYRLKINRKPSQSVKLIGRFLHVYTPKNTPCTQIKSLVDTWYREHAIMTFQRRLKLCLNRASSLRVSEPDIIVRPMKTRWGSCTKSGNLVLNTDLVKAPVDCIDYVIVHELCHLRVRLHSPTFYRLLTRSMHDWERRKKRLEHLYF